MEIDDKLLMNPKDTDASGYSEKKTDQDIELQAGQWLDLKQTKKPQTAASSPQKQKSQPKTMTSQNEKILGLIASHMQELKEDTDSYLSLIEHDKVEADEVFQKISNHHITLRSLLKALKWDRKGELNISKLPKEVQNLLK